MNARLGRVADSTPALLLALVVGTALDIDWRWAWPRALTIWATTWAAFVVLVVTR